MSSREKIFGRPKGFALDREAKVRLFHAARAYNASHKVAGQHHGPITRAIMQVLEAIVWKFHNSRKGDCFPSYDSIASKAKCCRDTVYRAIRILEQAELLTWVNCFVKARVRDEFDGWRWKIFRTSNFYFLRDPLPCANSHKSENPSRTPDPDTNHLPSRPEYVVLNPTSPLEAALIRLGQSMGRI